MFRLFGASSLLTKGERVVCGWQVVTIALYIHHIAALGRRPLVEISFFSNNPIQRLHVRSLFQILDLLCLAKEMVPNRAPAVLRL